MKRKISVSLLVLALSVLGAPFFLTNVHATTGCITSCLLKADTTVPASEGTIFVELDNNTSLHYSLPHTFSFANNSIHTLTILNSTFTTTSGSGARYVWNEWTRASLQWTPTLMMRTPTMLFNYTGPTDGGAFIAKFDKQFQYTLTFKDAAGNVLTPNPSSVTISGGGSETTTSSYSGQWLSATSWTVTSATWEGYQTALSSPVSLDLTSSSASAVVKILAYPASVKVVDKSSNPIQGASVTVTFANATTKAFTTGNLGTVPLGDIPYGSFTVSASYQGQNQGPIGEDATTNPVSTITMDTGGITSAPVVSGIVLLTIFGVALFLILLAIKVRKPPPPPQI